MDQIIKHFYADLVKTLPMDDPCFRSMLYSANLLPGNLKDEVKSMPTRAEKAEHFLDHGINNDTAKFLKLFEVLKQSDDNSVIKLTAQLRNEIDPHAVSNVTGFCLCLASYVRICIHHYNSQYTSIRCQNQWTRGHRSHINTFWPPCTFKPGARQPVAGTRLVS